MQITSDKGCLASSDYFYVEKPPIWTADNTTTLGGVDIYPNPVVEDVNIRLLVKEPANTTFILYDSHGRLIQTKELGMISSQTIESMNLSSYPSGTYLIRIKTNNEIVTRRLLKF